MRVRTLADEEEPAPPKLLTVVSQVGQPATRGEGPKVLVRVRALTDGQEPEQHVLTAASWHRNDEILDGLVRLHQAVTKADLAAVVELVMDSRSLYSLPKIREVLQILGELNTALAKAGAH
jgi:hypothetical protein